MAPTVLCYSSLLSPGIRIWGHGLAVLLVNLINVALALNKQMLITMSYYLILRVDRDHYQYLLIRTFYPEITI